MTDYWDELEKMEEERDAQEYAEAMAYSQGYEKGRADAIEEFCSEIDLEEPMHFTKEQVRWIKKYVIVKRHDAIDELLNNISESIIWDILAEVMKRNIGASEGADKVIDYLQEVAEQLKGNKE